MSLLSFSGKACIKTNVYRKRGEKVLDLSGLELESLSSLVWETVSGGVGRQGWEKSTLGLG